MERECRLAGTVAGWLVAGQAGGGKSSLAYSDPCLAVVASGWWLVATLCHTTGPADRCAAAAGEKVGKTSARLPGPCWCWCWCSGKKLNRVFLLPAASPVAALLPGAVVSRRRFLQEISRKWLFSTTPQPAA